MEETDPADYPPTVMNGSREKSWATGLFFLLLGIIGLIGASLIKTSAFTNPLDPGPAAFPIALSLLLVLGGILTCLGGWRKQRPTSFEPSNPPQTSLRPPSGPTGRRDSIWLMLGVLLAPVFLYLVGFQLTLFLFAALLIRRLGSRWGAALLSALLMTALIHLLFVMLFKVPVPQGEWGLRLNFW